ncbi:MAG: putative quinol monooxygenase [Ilumatobacteraceae bacterium]
MVIVGGTFEFDPGQRQLFIDSRMEMMRTSRAEPGCLEYSFCPDPLDASRVVLYERWESQDALDAHILALRAAPPSPDAEIKPITASVMIYDVSGERRIGR